jgi:putative SOS response-associated peptidase YedK
MCYDISFSAGVELITDYFPALAVDPQVDFDFGYYIHVQAQAFAKYPVVLFDHGQYQLKSFEWGVIADYMNTPEKIKTGRKWMCNAQAEKIRDDKRSYWRRIRHTRCLVPVTGIFEHREIRGWKNKVPYYIHQKDRPMFCLPGLFHYPHTADPETGEITGTFTVITRPANSLMRQIHNCGDNANRMPLFLPRELETKWLLPDLEDHELAGILDYQVPSEALNDWPVYTIRTSKERPDGKARTEPYEWAGLPPLGQDSSVQELF